ncbi:hypothetical protein [Rhodopseudomonas sp. BAL398]|nr:hypothetical protein [Rhodopseudomonas sp. BAL398]MDF3812933.1 hypothetical protein [Rhodopseudomonas sp. BAL398]WOK16016.1 hypothetical protein RBJ75_17795 [Rhodopseudomonas sp. BAL398]
MNQDISDRTPIVSNCILSDYMKSVSPDPNISVIPGIEQRQLRDNPESCG